MRESHDEDESKERTRRKENQRGETFYSLHVPPLVHTYTTKPSERGHFLYYELLELAELGVGDSHRPILLAIIILFPTVAHWMPYLLLLCLFLW